MNDREVSLRSDMPCSFPPPDGTWCFAAHEALLEWCGHTTFFVFDIEISPIGVFQVPAQTHLLALDNRGTWHGFEVVDDRPAGLAACCPEGSAEAVLAGGLTRPTCCLQP